MERDSLENNGNEYVYYTMNAIWNLRDCFNKFKMKCDFNCMGSDNRSYISDTIPHYFYYYVILSNSIISRTVRQNIRDAQLSLRGCHSFVVTLLSG